LKVDTLDSVDGFYGAASESPKDTPINVIADDEILDRKDWFAALGRLDLVHDA